ncbi:hypothetical protein VAB18032_17340 [Micromonospora maris AB-18-032]|nr:hypothetical protein VAB18032_17340 [Micromonospora maris AB-18-032]
MTRPAGHGCGEHTHRIRYGEVAAKRISPTGPSPVDRIRNMLGRPQIAGREEDLCAAFSERFGQKSPRTPCRTGDDDTHTIKIHDRQ